MIGLQVIKCHSDQDLSKSQRALKSYQWLKSYGLLLKGLILPIFGVASGRVCACSLLIQMHYADLGAFSCNGRKKCLLVYARLPKTRLFLVQELEQQIGHNSLIKSVPVLGILV